MTAPLAPWEPARGMARARIRVLEPMFGCKDTAPMLVLPGDLFAKWVALVNEITAIQTSETHLFL